MKKLNAIITRDIAIALRQGGGGFQVTVFFALAILMFAFAIGPEILKRSEIAAPVIWVCALLATYVSIDRIFQSDHDEGSLDILFETSDVLELTFLVKAFSHWLLTCAPLIALAPVAGLIMGLDGGGFAPLMGSLLVGTPALSLIGAMGAAMTLGIRRSNVLVAILIGPILTPVLIFGVGAATNTPASLPILGAITLFSLILTPIAGAAALRLNIN